MVGGGKDREKMRLIDADELIKAIENHKTNVASESGFANEIYALAHEHIIDVITIQPTVFDTEKVVEQLNNVLQDLNVIEILSQFDQDSTIQTSLDRFLNANINEVLNIVKKGGVE